MRVIGYSYEADVHCIVCAGHDYRTGRLVRMGRPGEYDERGLPMSLIDNEGNPVRPIFSTDERPEGGEHCGDCGAEIY